ncbi:hypothetical protein GB937_002247 [Aspergillus fischeri]|nr:hypothetical protein GB937_002247 [Aspergillus fischeri]
MTLNPHLRHRMDPRLTHPLQLRQRRLTLAPLAPRMRICLRIHMRTRRKYPLLRVPVRGDLIPFPLPLYGCRHDCRRGGDTTIERTGAGAMDIPGGAIRGGGQAVGLRSVAVRVAAAVGGASDGWSGEGKGAYAKTNFNDRPKDDRLAICVRFEVLDCKNADDLDDGDEEAEGEDGDEGGFLAALEAEGYQDGEGEGDDDAVEGETYTSDDDGDDDDAVGLDEPADAEIRGQQ